MVDDKTNFDYYVLITIKAIFMGNPLGVIVKLSYATVLLAIIIVDANDLVFGVAIHIDNLVTGITDVIEKFTKDIELEKNHFDHCIQRWVYHTLNFLVCNR
jgi:Na+/phosphate symporter